MTCPNQDITVSNLTVSFFGEMENKKVHDLVFQSATLSGLSTISEEDAYLYERSPEKFIQVPVVTIESCATPPAHPTLELYGVTKDEVSAILKNTPSHLDVRSIQQSRVGFRIAAPQNRLHPV